MPVNPQNEWLEADGLGGFASGTVSGARTRRYHALLLTATNPPTGRFVLVNGFDAWVETPAGRFALSTQHYIPDVHHPDGAQRIVAFDPDPWPRWRFRLEDGTEVEQEIFVRHGVPVTVLCWRLNNPQPRVTLSLRPLLSGRDYHATHHENAAFRFDADVRDGHVGWHPYPDVPGITAVTNGHYAHQPDWYRDFLYDEERQRGLDYVEDLATPGVFTWDLSRGEAILLLTTHEQEQTISAPDVPVEKCFQALRAAEHERRQQFPSRLHRSADAYLVRRGEGKTLVAGYPWFTDWGRDTFIALRGLCLATGRLEEAGEILSAWADTVSEGMLPNRFPDRGDHPEFNAVDASLWYVIAVQEFLQTSTALGQPASRTLHRRLNEAIDSILSGYAKGTRYNIRLDGDGLLASGEPGVQLTWMDVKIGDWVVTPRTGKPVEVQALWLNALHVGGSFSERWKEVFSHGLVSFRQRFWHEPGGYLYDVIDVDHQTGTVDATFRPNQIFAVGGLPCALLEGDRARRVVENVEARLWTPLGLRSLAPEDPGYRPHYTGGVGERDGAYHQGTVWPWLIGPFVEAWVRVRGAAPEAKHEARERFLSPLLRHLDDAGLGHVSEIADGDAPHTPRGCPFQAWSLGEVLRLTHGVLGEEPVRGQGQEHKGT